MNTSQLFWATQWPDKLTRVEIPCNLMHGLCNPIRANVNFKHGITSGPYMNHCKRSVLGLFLRGLAQGDINAIFPSFDRKKADLIHQRWTSKSLFPRRYFIYKQNFVLLVKAEKKQIVYAIGKNEKCNEK